MQKDVTLLRIKVAAAIALLRNKPAGVDTIKYVENICAKYVQAQALWRTKYLQAQETILHLRQRAAIHLSQHEASASVACGPTPPRSAEEHSDVDAIASSSADTLTASYQCITSIVHLTRAAQIINRKTPDLNTTGVHSNREDGDSIFPLSGHTNYDSLLAQTVPTCAQHLRRAAADGGKGLSVTCVLQGLEALVLLLNSDLMDNVSTGHNHNIENHQLLLKHLGDVVDDILYFLLDSEDTMQCLQRTELLHKMLQFLVVKMRAPEKFVLLHSISSHAKSLISHLQGCITGKLAVDPNSYERVAIAFDCLQQGITSVRAEEIDHAALQEIQANIEGAMDRRLTEYFPLVAHELLRLSAAVEMCLRSKSCS